jgi:hypothetical protein
MSKARLMVAAMVIAGSSVIAGAAPANAFNPRPDPPGREVSGETAAIQVSLGGPDTKLPGRVGVLTGE